MYLKRGGEGEHKREGLGRLGKYTSQHGLALWKNTAFSELLPTSALLRSSLTGLIDLILLALRFDVLIEA